MVSTAEIAREQEEGLALLFQRGLELALKVQEDAMTAETADERARLAVAFHRIARGVRLSEELGLSRAPPSGGADTSAASARSPALAETDEGSEPAAVIPDHPFRSSG